MAIPITYTPGEVLIFNSAQHIKELESLEKTMKGNSTNFYIYASELERLNRRIKILAGHAFNGTEGMQFRNNISDFQKKHAELQGQVLQMLCATTIFSKIHSSSSSSSSSSNP